MSNFETLTTYRVKLVKWKISSLTENFSFGDNFLFLSPKINMIDFLKHHGYTTCIFDLDGVIIDSEPFHSEVAENIFRELGITLSDKEHNSFIGSSTRNMWEQITRDYNISQDVESLLERTNREFTQRIHDSPDLRPIEGVDTLIKTLHEEGFQLVLASSSIMEIIDLVLEKMGLTQYFPVKISGAELTHSKPHPEIFQQAAKSVNSSPDKCVVIEDSQNGVNAAKSAGMYCVAYHNSNSGNQDLSKADYIIDNFRLLLNA